jgi:hypothetical protein
MGGFFFFHQQHVFFVALDGIVWLILHGCIVFSFFYTAGAVFFSARGGDVTLARNYH